MSTYEPVKPAKVAGAIVLAIVLFIVLIFALWGGWKAFHRYQVRADANNRVKVTAIEIRNQGQRVKVAQQQAQIRYENARGVREAQDEIAKTLTPLYVQFEMTEAIKEIARSGDNSSVIYIPSGAGGIPLISNADPTQVTAPKGD